MSFKSYFINESTEKKEIKKQQDKISDDYEVELRKLYKIKSVNNTAFGIQIEFFKKPNKDEILAIVKDDVKFKGNSIFIEF